MGVLVVDAQLPGAMLQEGGDSEYGFGNPGDGVFKVTLGDGLLEWKTRGFSFSRCGVLEGRMTQGIVMTPV